MNTLNLVDYQEMLCLCPHCGQDGDFFTKIGVDLGGAYAGSNYAGAGFIRAKCRNCNHTTPLRFLSDEGIKRSIKDWAEKDHTIPVIDLPTDAPIIVNYGAGVDSTCMIIKMIQQGIKPNLIMFADTGGEKRETYAYLDYFDKYLTAHGYPKITRVHYKPTSAPYNTLEGNCLSNQTLPSIAFRAKKNCSLKFKGKVMDDYLLGKGGANKCEGIPVILESLARGIKPLKLIGYDNGPADSRRAVKTLEDAKFRYAHPLRQMRLVREDCILEILAAGLRVPPKSACFFCPASKPWEVVLLAAEEPDKYLRAIQMEDTARDGKHGLTAINGLWSHEISWREYGEREGILSGNKIVMPRDQLIALALSMKPAHEQYAISELFTSCAA